MRRARSDGPRPLMQRFLVFGVGGPTGGTFPAPLAATRVRIDGTLVVDPQLGDPNTTVRIDGTLVVDPQLGAPNITVGIGTNVAIDPQQDAPNTTVGIGVTLAIL